MYTPAARRGSEEPGAGKRGEGPSHLHMPSRVADRRRGGGDGRPTSPQAQDGAALGAPRHATRALLPSMVVGNAPYGPSAWPLIGMKCVMLRVWALCKCQAGRGSEGGWGVRSLLHPPRLFLLCSRCDVDDSRFGQAKIFPDHKLERAGGPGLAAERRLGTVFTTDPQ